MKKFLLYAAVLALMAGPAMAQSGSQGERRGPTNPSRSTPNPSRSTPGTANQQTRPPRQTPQQAPQNRPDNRAGRQQDRRPNQQPSNRSERRPTQRPAARPRAARPRQEWNSWRSQNRNYFNRPARRFHAPRYNRPSGWYYRRWTFGDILPSLFWSSQYWINNYRTYALPPPPLGARWVRYGDDAVLIDQYSGQVIDVIHGIFY
jgi:Ni/Co efflux regulator RcnB